MYTIPYAYIYLDKQINIYGERTKNFRKNM